MFNRFWSTVKTIKVIYFSLSVVILTLSLIPHLNSPPSASAWTGNLSACGDWRMPIDWRAQLTAIESTYTADDSLVIASTSSQPYTWAPGSGSAMTYFYENGTKLNFTDTSGAKKMTKGSGSGYDLGIIYAPAQVAPNGQVGSHSSNTSDQSSFTCVFYAQNVTYTNWGTAPKFSSSVGTDTTDNCSSLDIACKIGNIFSTVADDILAVGQAMTNAIGFLFIPDTATISDSFNTLTSALNGHLGFLTWPFTAMADLFGAFTSAPDTSSTYLPYGCIDTLCTVYPGNFYGHAVTIPLAEPAIAMGEIWTWFLTITKVFIVVELLWLLKRKYHSVVQK
jgi:hypothetical protein